jgi:hypothetical protein
MGTRIPLPGNGGEALQRGVEQGSNMFQQFMGHGINLGHMHQQGQQFDKTQAFNEKQLAQTWQQHLQNLALHQQQEARLQEAAKLAAQFQPWQIADLKATINHHQAQTQDLQRKHTMLQQLMNGDGFSNQGAQNLEQGNEQPAEPFSMGEGMEPSFNAFGGQNMQQPVPPPMETVKNGFNNLTGPQAAFIKHETGFDPHAESPQEKSQRALEDKIKFENYKNSKENEKLTPAMITKLQEEVHYIQNVLPLLDELINMEPQTITWLGTSKDKAYESLTFNIAESLVKAKNEPNTNDSIKKMQKSITIGDSEKASSYKKRIEEEKKGLLNREKKTLSLLKNKKVASSGNEPSGSNKTLTYNPLTGRLE